MKKIFTLISAGILFLSVTAAARAPQIVLNSSSEYAVSIDGRSYSSNNTVLPDVTAGVHTIEVFRVTGGGIFGMGKKKTLVSSKQFNVRNNDVAITVDQYGQANISQSDYGNGNTRGNSNGGWNNDRNRNNGSWNSGRDQQNNDCTQSGRNNTNGNGNKYGHYKNKKDKKYDNDRRR